MSNNHNNVIFLKSTHLTAIVHPSAKIGDNVEIGPKVIIGANVEVGDGCKIGSNVIIEDFTKIGKNNCFYTGAFIGGKGNSLYIGDNNVFRDYATVNVATDEVGGVTRIGSNNLFQAYSQIESNCQIGNNVIIGNLTKLGKGVIVEDRVTISAMCEIANFTKIGKIVMIGGMERVDKDIPPFLLVDGEPAKVVGINVVGLRRNGIGSQNRDEIKKAYKILYRSTLTTNQALEKIEKELINLPEIEYFTQFIRCSESLSNR